MVAQAEMRQCHDYVTAVKQHEVNQKFPGLDLFSGT